VPLLDLRAQYRTIRAEIEDAVRRVFDSQGFILGPEVTGLEEEISSFTGAAHSVGMSSGTDALLAALMILEIGPGDEVVTTPYSFFATGGVISRLGAQPVFVDIDPLTFNMDADQAAAAITERTRAIMPVHLYGRVADMEPAIKAARERGIAIIEDAAQALGALAADGRPAGTIGDIGCFSFFPSKNLGGAGDGGMTVTNDAELARKLRIIRVHGSQPKYYHSVVGGNFRLDALQAAVLRVKLKHLKAWTAARRRNADRYRALMTAAGLQDTVTLPTDVAGHCYNQFVVRVPERDRLQAELKNAGIGTEIYYPLPLHLQECFASLGYRAGMMPESERAANETLALPIYPELTEEQSQYVVATMCNFYARAGVAR